MQVRPHASETTCTFIASEALLIAQASRLSEASLSRQPFFCLCYHKQLVLSQIACLITYIDQLEVELSKSFACHIAAKTRLCFQSLLPYTAVGFDD